MKGGTSTSSSSSKSSVTGTARLGFHPAVAGCQLDGMGVAAAGWAGTAAVLDTGDPDIGTEGAAGEGRETLPACPLATVRAATGLESNFVGSNFLYDGIPESNPAAITVIRTSSPSESSITVPKMMLASGCADSCTRDAASLISNSPRSEPPAMDGRTPCAPSIDASRNGELMPFSAACTDLPSPRAEPMPISALPAPDITLFTSAKSRLIRPGVVIRSVMP